MKHDFSAQFLRVLPPDTNFGEAWESLCYDLLSVDPKDGGLLRLAPPDRGVDILSRRLRNAYQCKSDERGAFGSLPAKASIDSLSTACGFKQELGWNTYWLCTNANYTGAAVSEITKAAGTFGLSAADLEFRGPQYWDELCSRHFDKVATRFDYRITATEQQVLDALKASRYFDRYVSEFEEKIKQARFSITIKNNRTPVEVVIPFSPELTVENCLDAAKQMLGLSLDWTNFTDLGTSAGPSLSLTVDRVAQGFSKKISELPLKPGDKLELWVKIIWKDETEEQAPDEKTVNRRMCLDMLLSRPEVPRHTVSEVDRRRLTVERTEELLQNMIWTGARKLRMPEQS